MERWAWGGAAAAVALLLLALFAVPRIYEATLPTTSAFAVVNDSRSRIALEACADRCIAGMVLDPGETWDANTATPIRSILVGGLGERRCLMPPRGVSRPLFRVSAAGSCPPFGLP